MFVIRDIYEFVGLFTGRKLNLKMALNKLFWLKYYEIGRNRVWL